MKNKVMQKKLLEGEVTKTTKTVDNREDGENKVDVNIDIPIAKGQTGFHLFFVNIRYYIFVCLFLLFTEIR